MTKAAKSPRQIPPRTVRVKPHAYQPSKVELDDPIILRNPDGSIPTVDEAADAVLRPVKIVEDSRLRLTFGTLVYNSQNLTPRIKGSQRVSAPICVEPSRRITPVPAVANGG